MSERNVEIVRGFFQAFARGDYAASAASLDDEVVLWSDPRANMETQNVRGIEAVSASIGEFVSAFDDYWLAEPDELIDAGDWVVAALRSGGRGRTSGVVVSQSWTVAQKLDEDKIVRIEFHPGMQEAIDAIKASGTPD